LHPCGGLDYVWVGCKSPQPFFRRFSGVFIVLFKPDSDDSTELRQNALPTDSNDIPVRILAQIDIGVLFFWGTGISYGWTQCGHTFYLVKIDADSHNVRKSGQQYCVT
jgi:hypothetical protein